MCQGLIDKVVLGDKLELMMSEVFFNLADSVKSQYADYLEESPS